MRHHRRNVLGRPYRRPLRDRTISAWVERLEERALLTVTAGNVTVIAPISPSAPAVDAVVPVTDDNLIVVVPEDTSYTTQDGTAVAGTDYTMESGVTTLEASYNVSIPILPNADYHAPLTFALNVLGAPSTQTATGTITIDSGIAAPVVTLSQSASTINDSGGTDTITATATTPATTDDTVTLTYSGTAVEGTNYTSSATIDIPAGSTTGTTTLTGLPTNVFGTASTTATTTITGLSGVSGATIGTADSVSTVITNTTAAPVVSLSQSAASINDTGGTDTITATSTTVASTDMMVALGFTGTAVEGTNYSAPTTIDIPAGSTTGTATITGIPTGIYGPNTTVITTASGVTGVTGATIGTPNAVTTTIVDTTAAPSIALSQSSSSINDTAGTDTITATATAAVTAATTVNLSFSGTAVQGTNYSISPTSITIPSGSTTGTATITGIPTKEYGPNTSVTTTITGVTGNGATIGAPDSVMTTIVDTTPVPVVTLSETGSPISESGGTATVTATLSNADSSVFTVPLIFGGTAVSGTNYTASMTSITILPGATTGAITITGVNDGLYGPNLTLTVGDSADATVAPTSITITNVNPEPTVSLSETGSPFSDLGGMATITATQSAASAVDTTVPLTFAGTAVMGTNYSISPSTTITIPAGSTTGTVDVTGLNDNIYSDGYTVIASLGTLINATPGTTTSVTLNESEGLDPPVVTLTIANSTVPENGGVATVIATQNEQSLLTTTVNLGFGGSAVSTKQYTASGSTITIPSLQLNGVVTLTGVDDNSYDPDTTVTAAITGVTNGMFSPPQQVMATFTNVDPPPSVSLSQSSPTISESGGTDTITATLSAAAGYSTTVNLGFSGTATPGTQYTVNPSTIVIPAGQTTGTATLNAVDDDKYGPNVTVTTSISSATINSVAVSPGGTSSLSTTITEADQPPAVSLSESGSPATDAGGVVTVTATLAAASGLPATLNLAYSGTAQAGVNYTAGPASITILAGATSASFNLTGIDDGQYGPPLNAIVAISSATGATSSGGTVTATFDPSTPAPSLSVNNINASQNSATVNFTVTLSSASSQTTTVSYTTMDGTAIAGVDYTTTAGTLTFTPGQTAQIVSVPILKDTTYGVTSRTFTLDLSNPTNATISTAQGTATLESVALPPSITATGTTITKSTSGTTDAFVTVQLSAASLAPVTVAYSTADITALAGTDYETTTGTLTFNPGQTVLTISIPIIGTTTPEGTRTFAVNFSNPTGATLSTSQVIVTVNDPNPPVGLYIANESITQSSATPGTMIFTVNLAQASGQTVSVQYATSNGTAIAGTDYLATSGTLTFAPGVTTMQFPVTILGVTEPAAPKQFTVTLSNPVNSTVSISTATGTIYNGITNPSLSINNITVVQPQSGTASANFTVELSTPSSETVTVGYATSDISAIAGTDYTQTSGTLTFNPGQVVQTITVPVLGTTVFDPNTKMFAVNLFAPTNALISTGTGIATLLNSNLSSLLTVSDATADAPETGTSTAAFTITLSAAQPLPVTFQYTTSNGTAIAGTDYTTTAGFLTIPVGSTSATVDVPILADTVSGPNKQFSLTLSNPQNATLFRATGQGIIVNTVPAPSLAIDNNVMVTAAATGTLTALFHVTLSAPSAQAITVNYNTEDGTAQQGVDYTAETGTLTFAAGQTVQTISIPVLNHSTPLPNKSFTVVLSGASNATIGQGTGTATILNTGLTQELIQVNDIQVADGTTGATASFVFTLSSPSTNTITLQYATANGTALAGTNYLASSGLVTFAPGQTTETVPITILPVTESGPNTQFTLNLTNPQNATLANTTATATILNDIALPSFSVDSITTTNTSPNAIFTVALNAPSAQSITVGYSTADGTAIAGTDYTSTTGTLTFAAGQTSLTVSVPLIKNTEYGLDTKTFSLNLANPTNAAILQGSGTATIVEENQPPSISAANFTQLKTTSGTVTATAIVTLSAASQAPVTVNYYTSDGTAVANVDYVPILNGTLTFAPGQTTATIPITIIGSSTPEGTRTFGLNFDDPTGATIATPQAIGTITDPNPPVGLYVQNTTDTVTGPASTTATFTVMLAQASGQVVQVQYATANGTALAGTNYLATSGLLTFSPGQTTQTVNVTVLGASVPEPSTTFTLTLSNPVNSTVSIGTGTATINNDITNPSLSIDSPTVTDAPTGTLTALFHVTLSAASGLPVTVNYSTADISAQAGTDYTAESGTLTFAAGQTVQTISVPVLNQTLPAPNKEFAVNLSGATNAAITTAQGIATIDNTGLLPRQIMVNDITVADTPTGTTATFDVTLSSASTTPVTFQYATANMTAIAGTNYLGTAGQVTIPAGQTTATITVQVLPETVSGPNQQFALNLTTPQNATLARTQALATILNTVPAPSLAIDNNVMVTDAATGTLTALFHVTLSAPSAQAITVNYNTEDGTAQQGVDYTAETGTLTFAAGQTVQTISIPVLNHSTPLPNKSFTVVLSGASNATIGQGTGTATILNTGLTQELIQVNDIQVADGTTGATASFVFTLSSPSTNTITLQYATANGTALAGTNYLASSGLVTFAPGQTTETVPITILPVTESGPNTQFTLNLTNPQNATLANTTATATILNDIALPSFSVDSITTTNTSPNAIFTVALNAPSAQSITVGYSTADGTAIAGTDYTSTTGTLTFAAGQTSLTVSVPLIKNTEYGLDTKTFSLNLANPTNAAILQGQGTATIVEENQPPSISAANFTQLKTTSGTVTATAIVTLSAASQAPVTVNYYTSDGTAVANVDYVPILNGTLTFAPGQTTATIPITIIGSSTPEGTRTFGLNFDDPTGATIATPQAIGTITDPNPPVGLYVQNTTDTVTGPASTTAIFTVMLAQASGQVVQVQYATANGTALAGTNYLATSGLLTFSPGQTTQTVNVTVLGASVPEPSTTFTLTLSNPVNSTVSIGTGTATINNDITNPSLSIDSPTVTDAPTGTLTALFHVTLSAASGLPVTVNYSTADISAQAGTDYTAESGTLTFAAGQTVQTISVPVLNQTLPAPNKEFAVNLSGATNAAITTAQGIATIDNTGLLPRQIAVNDITVADGPTGATATFTFTLSTASTSPVTFQYATADGTALAGTNYLATSGLVTFEPGQTTETVPVTVLPETVSGPNTQFTLKLSAPQNATLANTTATATIVNTVAEPVFSVSSIGTTNTSPNAIFTVSLSGPSTQSITVGYSTADGTAIAGTDYTSTSGTLTFAAGQTSLNVTVPLIKDTVYGLPTKTFTLNLANPTNAAILQGQGTATIVEENLPPTITAANFTQLKSTAGTVNATATLQLSAASQAPVTVSYYTSDITAIAGTDYVATMGTVTFAPGQVTQTVSIPIIGSTTPEGTRTFALNLDDPTGATIATPQAIGTITDPNPPVGLAVENSTVTVSGPAGATAMFTVQLAQASGQTVTVNYATANGTALANTNYLATSGTLTFAPGQTSETISVPILGTTVPEPIETFTLNLSSAVNSTIMTGTATGTIINTVAAPALSINSVSTILPTSGTTNLTFQVTLSAPSGVPVTVNYATADISALAGIDYTAETGTLTFAAGQTVQTIIVPILSSTALGPDKTFSVNLSGASNATVTTAQGIGTIENNNLVRDLTVNDVRAAVPAAGTTAVMTFTVTLSAPSPVEVTVQYATADMTAVSGTDYDATAGQLSFAPGQTTATVNVTILGNGLSGPNKQFALNLTNAQNATITRAQALGIIVNDNPEPLFSVSDVSTTNASSAAVFTVTLSQPSAQAITVSYTTMDGTAVAGTDYTSTSGTLTFQPGVTSQVVSVPIIKGTIYGPAKTFTLNLSNATNAGFLDTQATATIQNVTAEPSVTVSAFSVTKPASGSVPAIATLQLSAPSGLPVTVSYTTANGSAIAGVDYTATTGTVTFTPGQTTQTVSIPVLGNTTPSANLQFLLNLTLATGATIATNQATGTIINPNPAVGLSVNNPTVIQNTSGSIATFQVTLAQASGQTVMVSYNTANLTAIAGTDYLPAQGTLTFAPGQTVMTVQVSVLGATAPANPKQFALLLTNPVNTTITTSEGVATILNEVPGPNISIANASVVKPHTGTVNAVFTVTLSEPSNEVVTVNYATADSTAIGNANYIPTSGTLTFAAGQTVQTITVPVLGNTTPGPNLQFFVNLSGSTNALVTQAQATGTILNEDTSPGISIDNVSVVTGPIGPINAVFTVTLSEVGTLPVAVNYATMDGTARAGTDYTAENGVLTFAPGVTALTITVPINTTATPGPTKQFTLNLSGATNGTITTPQATGTILNGNLAPTVSVDNVTVTAPTAGTTAAVFTVQLSGPSQLPITVNYTTADNTALAGTNYTATSGTLTFAPGQTIQTFSVPILAEPLNDTTRTFNVILSSPSNATINVGQGTGTILNNVAVPVLTVGNATVTVPNLGSVLANFTITLSSPSDQVVTVAYATMDGSAVAGVDYTAESGTLTFQPGQTTQTVGVPVLATSAPYGGYSTKVFLLTVSNPVNATLGNLQGVGTIEQTEGPPALSINSVTVNENDLSTVNAIFTVTLEPPSDLTATVNFATADVTAVAGVDYTAESGTLIFDPGQTVQYITVPVLANLQSGNETFAVNLSSPVNATISQGTGYGYVINSNSTVVSNTNDSGPGSLRSAILLANILPGPQTITFDLPGPGPYTINVRSPLPTITNEVTIDGRTQPGYSGTPIIDLNGGAGAGANGLTLTGGDSGVYGLAINGFGGSGIEITGRGGDVIQGDYIGTTLDGNGPDGNLAFGIQISNASTNLIGGTDPSQRNVISGNLEGGVHIDPSSNNFIVGNYIGTNAGGDAAIPNGNNGVYIQNSSFTTVTDNVISGNGTNGVKIYGPVAMRNRVIGNIIGGSANGGGWLGNQGYGVIVNNVSVKARNIVKPNTITTNTLGAYFKGRRFGHR